MRGREEKGEPSAKKGRGDKHIGKKTQYREKKISFPLRVRGVKTKENVANGQRGRGQNNEWNELKRR